MSHDPGATELAEVLETASVPLENAIEDLASALEESNSAESGVAKLPKSAQGPIVALQAYYRRLLDHVGIVETSNPARREAIKALQRMGTGLGNLATAVDLEGKEAQQEAETGAIQMERAESELSRALGRLT